MGENHDPCSDSSPVSGENQGSGLASPSLCCHDVSQLLPSAFPSRMSNSAVITFNVPGTVTASYLKAALCFISRAQDGDKVEVSAGGSKETLQEMHSVPIAASAFGGEGAL